jgi:hypothetical protein
MRFRLVFAVAIATLAGCKKSSTTTALSTTDSLSVAGLWSGCLTEPLVPCSPISMTLTDSSLTDSSETVAGAGNWGESVAIQGKAVNAVVTLNASTEGLLQHWSFDGTVSGNSMIGTMIVPGSDTTYQATFARAP